MNCSPEITALVAALSIAQGVFAVPKKSRTNPFFNNSKYADLSDVIDAVKEGLAKNDLAVIQGIEIKEDQSQILITRLTHKTGQWIETVCPLLLDKKTMQGLGSANSYARRYALSSILGVASEDDDGNEASKDGEKKPNDPKSGTPQIKGTSTPPQQSNDQSFVSEPQVKRLFAIAGARNWTNEQVKLYLLAAFQLESTKDLRRHEYDKLINVIESHNYVEAIKNV